MTEGLVGKSLDELSDSYWGICNREFDRDIWSAQDMELQRRGNCFSLSEYLCLKLSRMDPLLKVGVCLEILPSRRNYHASAWAVSAGCSYVMRLDLLDDTVTKSDGTYQLAAELLSLHSASKDSVSVREALVVSTPQRVTDRAINQPIVSETAPASEAVYLSQAIGVAALHALAAAGGTKHLLDTQTADPLHSILPRN